jgi:hypothetical protein
LYRVPGLGPAVGGHPLETDYQTRRDEIDAFMASSDDSYFLSVDGRDLSADYARCHASTGRVAAKSCDACADRLGRVGLVVAWGVTAWG